MPRHSAPEKLPSTLRSGRPLVVQEVVSRVRRRSPLLDNIGLDEINARITRLHELISTDEVLLILARRHIEQLEARLKVYRRDVGLFETTKKDRGMGVVISQKVLVPKHHRCLRCDKPGTFTDAYCGAGCRKRGPRKKCLNCEDLLVASRVGQSPYCDLECERVNRASESEDNE